jgi:hypothetical protein
MSDLTNPIKTAIAKALKDAHGNPEKSAEIVEAMARAKCRVVWGDEELWAHFLQDAKELLAMLEAMKEQE